MSPFLESSLLAACPGLRESWTAHRRTFAGGGEPGDVALLDAVRRHVVELLVMGRAAEFARFTRSLERLLVEADPMLDDLLQQQLVRPLAADVAAANVPEARVVPHLGPRLAAAWRDAR